MCFCASWLSGADTASRGRKLALASQWDEARQGSGGRVHEMLAYHASQLATRAKFAAGCDCDLPAFCGRLLDGDEGSRCASWRHTHTHTHALALGRGLAQARGALHSRVRDERAGAGAGAGHGDHVNLSESARTPLARGNVIEAEGRAVPDP